MSCYTACAAYYSVGLQLPVVSKNMTYSDAIIILSFFLLVRVYEWFVARLRRFFGKYDTDILGNTVNQDVLLDSITKALDSLSTVTERALLLAVVFWWAGVQKQLNIKVFDVEIPRTFAFYAASIVYLFINASILYKFLHIRNLVKLVDESHFSSAVTRIILNQWFCNPFSFYGSSLAARAHSSKGIGSLIVVWWFCNSSLVIFLSDVMTGDFLSSPRIWLMLFFITIGISTLNTVGDIRSIIASRLESNAPELYNQMKKTTVETSLVTYAAFMVGFLIWHATITFSNNIRAAQPTPRSTTILAGPRQ